MNAPTRPADPASILSLAAGIGALVLALFSVLPMVGICTLPLSVICVAVSVVSAVASLIRTAINPALEGRMQALAGLGLSLLWCAGAGLIFVYTTRAH